MNPRRDQPLAWKRTEPRGNTFPCAVVATSTISYERWKTIEQFLTNYFGSRLPPARYARSHDYIAFRNEADLVFFLVAMTGDV